MRGSPVFFVCLGLTSCGTYLPEMTSPEKLPLELLVAKIDCEFQVAVWTQKIVRKRTFLEGWQAQYTITLKSNEIGSTKALTNTFPFLPSKNLGINASIGAGETTTANRTALMKFNLAFDSVKQEPVCAKLPTNSLHPFLTGRIGFEEWMDRAFEGAELGGRIQLGERQRISSLGHTFQFTLDVNANAGAGFVIGPAPAIGINPSATISRLDDGIVDVAIAKPAVDQIPQLITALTQEQRELIAKLNKLIKNKQESISDRKIQLAAPDNRMLVDKLSQMDKMTIERMAPDDAQQQQTFGLDRQQIMRLQRLKSLQDENKSDEQAIKELQKEKAEIRPQVTVDARPRILPPDRNPEIANTSLQLTFERLNNSLRPVP